MCDAEKMALERMSLAGHQALAQLADSDIDQMIAALGKGIAQAQFELDSTSVRIAQMMTGEYGPALDEEGLVILGADGRPVLEKRDTRVDFAGEKLSLLELGFTPTFYQFIETVIEVKVSISLDADVDVETVKKTRTTTKETSGFFRRKTKTSVRSTSTRFSARFNYSVEGSSYVRTKLVPVPPPESLLDVLAQVVEEKKSGG